MSTVDWEADTRHVIESRGEAVRAVGLADVWDHLITEEPSAARSLLIGTVGALAAYMHEKGLAAHSP